MAIVDLDFVELHSPLFFGGKNFGQKLDPHKHREIGLQFDKVEKELIVTWMGKRTILPQTSVQSYVEKGQGHMPMKNVTADPQPQVKAQVSTPQDHVFAGVGNGKVK